MKDKKQTIQMVVLGGLIAVFVGYFVFTTIAKKPAPAQAASAKPYKPAAATGAQNGAGPTDSTAVAQVPAGTAVVEVSGPVIAGEVVPAMGLRDPFEPNMSAAQDTIPSESSTKPVQIAMHRPMTPVIPNISGPLPPMGAGTSTYNGAQNGSDGKPKPEEAPMPQFAVTGVITGRENVGIMRLGESRYIVKEGQKINGIYEVVSVSQEGVLIARDGHSVFVKLGGDGNASQK